MHTQFSQLLQIKPSSPFLSYLGTSFITSTLSCLRNAVVHSFLHSSKHARAWAPIHYSHTQTGPESRRGGEDGLSQILSIQERYICHLHCHLLNTFISLGFRISPIEFWGTGNSSGNKRSGWEPATCFLTNRILQE